MGNKPKTTNGDHLRALARERLGKPTVDTRSLSASEIGRLVYELEIHQEELEIQNEELRRAQLEIKSARDRYLNLYDFAPVGYVTLDANSQIVEANLTACELLGKERSALIGMRLDVFCDAASRTQLRSSLDEVLSTGVPSSVELRLVADRELYVKLDSCRGHQVEGQTLQCRSAITDISTRKLAEFVALEKEQRLQQEIVERQHAEDRLREQEKKWSHVARMNTMGAMVAGIAHEINQPLQAISTYATACELKLQQRDLAQNEEVAHMVRQISEQAIRSGKIIRSQRDFVKKAETSRSDVQISDVIVESVRLTEFEARRYKATVCVAIDEPLPEVLADRIQIQQVIVNLIINACQAMDAIDGPRPVTIRASAQEDRLDVAVEDQGEGLGAEIASTIFDAFQSTKEDGMGLGLAISRAIIEAHDGKIWATPNPKGGTIFHFTLPVRPRT